MTSSMASRLKENRSSSSTCASAPSDRPISQLRYRLPAKPDGGADCAGGPVSFRGRGYLETPVYRRESLGAGFTLTGPAIIEEPDSTTVVHPGDTLIVRPDGLLELQLG